MKFLIPLCLLLTLLPSLQAAYPNVIFHGIGDSCANPGMGAFTLEIANLTGVYSTCIALGADQGTFSITDPLEDEGANACGQILNDTNLQGTFNVVGLSQGGLLARYIIEKCNIAGRVSKYLSIGGPQMGVSSFPQCASGGMACYVMNGLTRSMVYTTWAQNNIAPAGYFKDMSKYQEYLEYSSFLADLNNERDNKTASYAANIEQLDGMMLVMFDNDTMLDPPSTAWFSYFDVNGTVIDMQDQELYTEDWIGLKSLNEAGKVQFVALEGNHLSFTNEDVVNTFVPFLIGETA